MTVLFFILCGEAISSASLSGCDPVTQRGDRAQPQAGAVGGACPSLCSETPASCTVPAALAPPQPQCREKPSPQLDSRPGTADPNPTPRPAAARTTGTCNPVRYSHLTHTQNSRRRGCRLALRRGPLATLALQGRAPGAGGAFGHGEARSGQGLRAARAPGGRGLIGRVQPRSALEVETKAAPARAGRRPRVPERCFSSPPARNLDSPSRPRARRFWVLDSARVVFWILFSPAHFAFWCSSPPAPKMHSPRMCPRPRRILGLVSARPGPGFSASEP